MQALVANYGGGVNSVAQLLFLYRLGVKPVAIIMSDPGHEKTQTHVYRETIVNPWLRSIEWPEVVLVSRETEAVYRPRSQWKGSLGDDCYRKSMLPSAAYGLKSCSMKFKAEPMIWYLLRQGWAKALWEQGGRITRAIGYDRDESKRVNKHRHYINGAAVDEFSSPGEAEKFKPWYPLYDAGVTRDGCEDLIKAFGWPLPVKSSCTFCPYNSLKEWTDLRENYPKEFAYAVELSKRAETTVTSEQVGLMRRAQRDSKTTKLHVWAERASSVCSLTGDDDDDTSDRPCECAE